jgi:ferrous iron transport protein B
MKDKLTVALAGNPNCGKTTLFNNLTGARQHVGNYPGVTVEKKEGFCRYQEQELVIVDLPGTYSLTAFSPEEVVTRHFIAEKNCHVLLSVVDASNLERNLYLTTQLLELEQPVVLVLNMIDVAEDRQISIDDVKLAKELGVPVVRVIGNQRIGMADLLKVVVNRKPSENSFKINYGPQIEACITSLQSMLSKLQQRSFPDRWVAIKLLENDNDIMAGLKELSSGQEILKVADELRIALTAKLGVAPELAIANIRYQLIGKVYNETVSVADEEMVTVSDKIDRVLTNRVLGIPIFLFLMWLLFNLVFSVGEYPKGWLEDGVSFLADILTDYLPGSDLKSLFIDGIIRGVGGVVVFLPNILLLFFVISLLEDTGYMARAAFIMDKVMHKVGLHGKSFIPLLVGFGCSVPAVMGTRTLENPRDRLVTILIAPLMSCSARLPFYTVMIGAFFSEQAAGSILFSIYLLGIILAITMAKVFRSVLYPGESEPFVMELPPYRIPSLKSTLLHMWERSMLYLRKAGTLILAMSILMWFLANYPTGSADVSAAERLSESYAASIGKTIEPVIRPLGFDWKVGVGLVGGFSAKEVLVSTLSTIYSVGEDEGTVPLQHALQADPFYNPLKAYALMVFVLVYSPCLATIAVIKRETGSLKWAVFTSVYSTGLAWILAFIVYHGGRLLGVGI